MEFDHLRALVAVAETGSVTEAARRLFRTQPAVTRQIRALEDELKGTLFDRTTKPLVLTPLGKTALEQARRILQTSEDFRTLVRSSAGTLVGELRMGVSSSLARHVTPPLVLAMQQRFPGVQLQLTVGWSRGLIREVEDGLLDAAIVLVPSGAHRPPTLDAIHLGTEGVTLVSSTKTKLKGRVPPEAVRDVRWVLKPEGCGSRAMLKRALEGIGVPLAVAVEVVDTDLQLQLIGEGVGAGIIATRALPRPLGTARLQAFEIAGSTFSFEAWLLHRRNGSVVSAVMPAVERTVLAGVTWTKHSARRDRALRSASRRSVGRLRAP
jgi:DNA-binding transcriptional LysR family regulator